MLFELFKISTQSVTRAVRANANVNCYCIIWIVHKFLQLSNAEQSLLFYTVERIFDVREVKWLLKLELRLLDSRSNQVSRVESKLNSKQNYPL